MKRIVIWVIMFALLLAGCGPSVEETEPPKSSKEEFDWGISLTAEEVTPTGLTMVFIQSGGAPTGELDTGSYYSLEVLTDGQWKAVEMLPQEYEVAWNSIAYLLTMEGETKFTIDWEWLYGSLGVGSYRIGKEVMDFRAAGDYDQCVYYAYFEITEETADHTHALASEPLTVEDPISGYCGNTVTTIYKDGKEYSFMYEDSVTLTDILINLAYDPGKVCRCAAEYTVDTEFGDGYELNLTEGFARCEAGQAELTAEQVEAIQEIISRQT